MSSEFPEINQRGINTLLLQYYLTNVIYYCSYARFHHICYLFELKYRENKSHVNVKITPLIRIIHRIEDITLKRIN